MANKALLTNIQICRGMAAAMVVVGHSLQDWNVVASHAGIATASTAVNWGCGVNIFFVISGFIMVHVAGADFGKPGASLQFVFKRFQRIVPSYWLITSVLIAGSLIAPKLLNEPIGGAWHILASYLFIPDVRPGLSIVRPVLALGWTLNYEMLFYLVFAATMVLPFNKGVVALTALFATGIALRMELGIQQTQIAFWLDPIVVNFLFGVAIGVAYRDGFRLSGRVAIVLAACGLFFTALAAPEGSRAATDLAWLRYGAPAALLVAAVALGPDVGETRLTRLGVLIGDASYALYLVHPFVVRPMREVWTKLGAQNLPAFAYCLACLVVATLVAFAMHRWFELPVGRALRRCTPSLPALNASPKTPAPSR